MKISKRQLKRIIKEEKQKLFSEIYGGDDPMMALENRIANLVEDLITKEMENYGLEGDSEAAMAIAAGIDRAKAILRY